MTAAGESVGRKANWSENDKVGEKVGGQGRLCRGSAWQ